MKKKIKKIYLQKKKRYLNKIVGSSNRPRLSVFRSNIHIYAQLIDDSLGQTLVSYSTLEQNKDKTQKKRVNKKTAFEVGIELGKRAVQKEIDWIVFDRGNYSYHGKVQKLAEGARQEGLIF
jgi:large subunit ribosomal protein L18